MYSVICVSLNECRRNKEPHVVAVAVVVYVVVVVPRDDLCLF